jgi:hypothetical protein
LFIIGADADPLAGQRQSQRLIPPTFIREDFTSVFADSTEALISLASTQDSAQVYLNVMSDVTGNFFQGRSGSLLTPHPPEFAIPGWDYDDDGGDEFNTAGIILVLAT